LYNIWGVIVMGLVSKVACGVAYQLVA
jgi:hypothetical protein